MTEQQIQNLLMVGKFMDIENLFPYQSKNDKEPWGVYIAEDETGCIDYVDVGINFYNPHSDWNTLMRVCKKIIDIYKDNRQEIFLGLQKCDIDRTYNGCVEFIKFWNDDTQEKTVWNTKA